MLRNARRPAPPSFRTPALRRLAPALAAALLAAAGCGPQQEGMTTGVEPAEPERVENPALGIALVGPQAAGFDVVTNEGETLVLVRHATGDQAEAAFAYEVSPPQVAGVNLVEAVNEQKAAIEARPHGNFLGQVQLMSEVLGNAYSTRGRFTGEEGEEIEEVKLFAVHPSGDRLLSVTSRYRPAEGGSKARLDQAMAALGLIEPLMPEAEPEGGEPAPGE
jgi:hypothetical protein